MMVSTDTQVLTSGICKCVTLHGKWDFVVLVKVQDLVAEGIVLGQPMNIQEQGDFPDFHQRQL